MQEIPSRGITHSRKLDSYREFSVNELTKYPFLSSAQIHDHLKEHFDDLPDASAKTVYNYVMRIREEEGISKVREKLRQTSKLPECEYGEFAQADYGEKSIHDVDGHRVKIHFFCMLLCRSR